MNFDNLLNISRFPISLIKDIEMESEPPVCTFQQDSPLLFSKVNSEYDLQECHKYSCSYSMINENMLSSILSEFLVYDHIIPVFLEDQLSLRENKLILKRPKNFEQIFDTINKENLIVKINKKIDSFLICNNNLSFEKGLFLNQINNIELQYRMSNDTLEYVKKCREIIKKYDKNDH